MKKSERILRLSLFMIPLIFFWSPSPGRAQILGIGPADDPVSIKTYTSLTSASRGSNIKIAIELEIRPPWHINAHRVRDDFLIPTEVRLEPPEGITLLEVVYPKSIDKKLPFSKKPLALYESQALIGIIVGISPDFPEGDTTLAAEITYQACDNARCLAPVKKEVSIPIRVSSVLEAIGTTHTDIFAKINFSKSGEGEARGTFRNESGAGTGRSGIGGAGQFQEAIAAKGLFFAFLVVFIGGLGLNLTPCVYPIIPITVSYFGGQSGGRSYRTILLAVLYVLGMATMYSSLGLTAALTGSMLGSALQNPFVISFVALVMVILSLSMFGLYEFRFPGRISNLAGTSKRGPLGAFSMGLTVGIVAAPCIGPFVLGLLTFVGEKGNPFLGFFLFFTLAIGLGLPFVVLAFLSGNISSLPRSGEWMEWVKKLFGVVLIAMAIYFLEPILGGPAYFALMGVLFIVSGLVLGFTVRVSARTLFFLALRRFYGIAAPLFGLYLILSPGHIIARGEGEGIRWKPYNTDFLEEARAARIPVIIDFFADWCIPCKELDHRTFSQAEVIEATEGIVALKADLTQASSQEVVKLRKAYRIWGVPTVVFIDRNGNERSDLRVLGFVNKTEFLRRLAKLKESS